MHFGQTGAPWAVVCPKVELLKLGRQVRAIHRARRQRRGESARMHAPKNRASGPGFLWRAAIGAALSAVAARSVRRDPRALRACDADRSCSWRTRRRSGSAHRTPRSEKTGNPAHPRHRSSRQGRQATPQARRRGRGEPSTSQGKAQRAEIMTQGAEGHRADQIHCAGRTVRAHRLARHPSVPCRPNRRTRLRRSLATMRARGSGGRGGLRDALAMWFIWQWFRLLGRYWLVLVSSA